MIGERLYRKIDSGILRMTKVISYGAMVCLAAIMLLAFFDTLSTKLLRVSITNATELIQYLNVPVVFLAIGYVELERGSTRIELLITKFPKKVQKLLLAMGNILGFGICAFAAYINANMTLGKFVSHTRASAGQASSFFIWPFCLVLALGYLLVSLAFLWNTIKQLRWMKHPELEEQERVIRDPFAEEEKT